MSKLFTEAEVTELTGLSRMTLYRYRTSRELGFVRIGNRVLYRPEHLEQFVVAHERAAKESRR